MTHQEQLIKAKHVLEVYAIDNKLPIVPYTFHHFVIGEDLLYLDGKEIYVYHNLAPFELVPVYTSISTWIKFDDNYNIITLEPIRIVNRQYTYDEVQVLYNEPKSFEGAIHNAVVSDKIIKEEEPSELFSDLSGTASYIFKKPKRKNLLKKIEEMQVVIDLLCDCKSMCWDRAITNKEAELLQKYKK
jgi:hypothetical protein